MDTCTYTHPQTPQTPHNNPPTQFTFLCVKTEKKITSWQKIKARSLWVLLCCPSHGSAAPAGAHTVLGADDDGVEAPHAARGEQCDGLHDVGPRGVLGRAAVTPPLPPEVALGLQLPVSGAHFLHTLPFRFLSAEKAGSLGGLHKEIALLPGNWRWHTTHFLNKLCINNCYILE